MAEELIDKYKALNNSFNKRFVYHLGGEGGFFSEFNNMVLAILYCLRNKIKFSIYCKDANFKYDKGWNDYFLPFCEEYGTPFHAVFNRRPFPISKYKLANKTFDLISCIFRSINPSIMTTSDLWNDIRKQSIYDRYVIEELGIDGDLLHATRQIISMIWRYRPDIEQEITDICTGLNLNEPYFGFHIRGGDKFIEANLLSPSEYINRAEEISDIKKAFVLTDDYRVIEHLETKYPNWSFKTLCTSEERGYFHQSFKKENAATKKKRYINLFASMDILSKSEYFIGTFSSNPGMFMGMRMDKGRAISLDVEKWCIW